MVSKNNTTTKEEVGVYAVSCNDCHSFYFGETGRDLKIRIQEHKKVVKEMAQNSAIAKHCCENKHRMNWETSKILHKSGQVDQRRVVKGALINTCNSIDGNKLFTQEDRQTDQLICKTLKINIDKFIKSSDLSPRVLPDDQ